MSIINKLLSLNKIASDMFSHISFLVTDYKLLVMLLC